MNVNGKEDWEFSLLLPRPFLEFSSLMFSLYFGVLVVRVEKHAYQDFIMASERPYAFSKIILYFNTLTVGLPFTAIERPIIPLCLFISFVSKLMMLWWGISSLEMVPVHAKTKLFPMLTWCNHGLKCMIWYKLLCLINLTCAPTKQNQRENSMSVSFPINRPKNLAQIINFQSDSKILNQIL